MSFNVGASQCASKTDCTRMRQEQDALAAHSCTKKRIVVLGSTGSIGRQTLDVVRRHPDKLAVVGLAAHSSIELLCNQAAEFDVPAVALHDKAALTPEIADRLHDITKRASAAAGQDPFVATGAQAVVDLAALPEADIVVNALVGAAGLRASMQTLQAGSILALANKESLVVGGDLIMQIATHDTLRPIDSEHGAIYQCLLGEQRSEVSKLWVTASGGPFRGKTRVDLQQVTAQDALRHPTWQMGKKITIDSSTLMNKGLEVIEAHHLFAMPYEQIAVVVQPQSAIHSMVEFTDGSVKAHLGTTDMRIPIQFALSYPDRWEAPVAPLDFTALGTLEFEAPDTHTFPCLRLAYEAGSAGGIVPCVMNAANEVAVAAFLAGACSYLGIAEIVEKTMEHFSIQPVESLEQLLEIDTQAREVAQNFLG